MTGSRWAASADSAAGSSRLRVGVALLVFAAVSAVTSLFLGEYERDYDNPRDPGEFRQMIYRDGNPVTGPFEVAAPHTIQNIQVHRGIRGDNASATIQCEVLDERRQSMFAFQHGVWSMEGWDDEGYWGDHDSTFDLNVTFPSAGVYFMRCLADEEGVPDEPRELYRSVDIEVTTRPVARSHVPHVMGAVFGGLLGVLLLIAGFARPGGRRRVWEAAVVLGLVAVYAALFAAAGRGYGYAGPDGPASFFHFRGIDTDHGAEINPRQQAKNLDTIYFDNGDVYAGEVLDGKPHGRGRLIKPDRTVFFGEFRDGRQHGHIYVDYMSGGYTHYEGRMERGLWHGHGRLVTRAGDSYEGEFNAGKRHGHGTYSFSDGNEITGDFANDVPVGRVTMEVWGGGTYEGEVLGRMRHGRGRYEPRHTDEVLEGRWELDEYVGP